jgi:transposase-like protein
MPIFGDVPHNIPHIRKFIAEEKWQIVLKGLKSGNIAETCRTYEIAPNLYYRWKDEVEQGARLRLGVRAQPRALTKSRHARSGSWSGLWTAVRCRSRS